jgi:hypothetical protein
MAVVAETGARERAETVEALLAGQVEARVAAVRRWPAGRRCPLGRLREAWVAHRYGPAKVVDAGTALAGAVPSALPTRVLRAIELYEAHAEYRPPGWPTSGPSALCVLAAQQRADVFAGDVARLLLLAKGMRAATLIEDSRRVDRARARAAARQAPVRGRLTFRLTPRRTRIETAELRRLRVRDAVLLLDRDPASWPNAELALAHLPITPGADEVRLIDADRCEELDGVGARAARYRAELKRGRWKLP